MSRPQNRDPRPEASATRRFASQCRQPDRVTSRRPGVDMGATAQVRMRAEAEPGPLRQNRYAAQSAGGPAPADASAVSPCGNLARGNTVQIPGVALAASRDRLERALLGVWPTSTPAQSSLDASVPRHRRSVRSRQVAHPRRGAGSPDYGDAEDSGQPVGTCDSCHEGQGLARVRSPTKSDCT